MINGVGTMIGFAAVQVALLPSPPDHVLEVARINLTLENGIASALADLVKVAVGDPKRVVTVADYVGATAIGARTGMEDITSIEDAMRWDQLGTYAGYAAEGRFTISASAS